MRNIFVYGTLKKGYHNHRLLEGCELISDNFIVSGFKLFESGIPFMKRSNNSDMVLGEVYSVDDKTLSRLDSLEGHPNWYRREIVHTPFKDLSDDLQVIVEGYVYQKDLQNCPESPKINGVYVYGR